VLGVPDKVTDVSDVAFILADRCALLGAIVLKVKGVPLTLSTAGALIAGLVGGWLRSVRPSFGHPPHDLVHGPSASTSLSPSSYAGPNHQRPQDAGIGLFLWGVGDHGYYSGMFVAGTSSFHDALTRHHFRLPHTTASLGLVCDMAHSRSRHFGYTVTYAVGNTLLTIWGMVLIMMLSWIMKLLPACAQVFKESSMDNIMLKQYEKLAFEIKDQLAKIATRAQSHPSPISTPAAEIPTGSPPSHAKPFYCWGSLRSPKASAFSTCRPASAACPRPWGSLPALRPGWRSTVTCRAPPF
jgi:hypothetical protein